MLRRILIPIFFLFIWIIMNEGITVVNIISGIIVVISSLYITSYLLDFDYVKSFHLPVFKILRYLLYLIKEIYICGFRSVVLILSGDVKPSFIKCEINPNITNIHLHNLISSSITLTPGTITVENKEGNLTVLSLHDDGNSPSLGFESKLIEFKSKPPCN